MAWHFDEINDDVQIADNAVLTFPDADWTLGGWVKLRDDVGTNFQYFFSWGAFSATPSFNWFFHEVGQATPLIFHAVVEDGAANTIDVNSTGTPGANTQWQHVLMTRTGAGVLTQYINAIAFGTASDVDLGAIDVGEALFFGSRSDGNVDRFLGGDMAEWFKLDRALNHKERSFLAEGMSPQDLPDKTNFWHVMMEANRYRAFDKSAGPSALVVTNNGSFPRTHPPKVLEWRRRKEFDFLAKSVAVAGLQMPLRQPFAPSIPHLTR